VRAFAFVGVSGYENRRKSICMSAGADARVGGIASARVGARVGGRVGARVVDRTGTGIKVEVSLYC
jgi:hypothetical protein